jgi:hypothetical protein
MLPALPRAPALVLLLLAVMSSAGCRREAETPVVEEDLAHPAAVVEHASPTQTDPSLPTRPAAPATPAAQPQSGNMLTMAETVAAQGDPHALAVAAMLRDAALSGAGPAGGDAPAPARRMDDTVRGWLDEAERRAPDDLIALLFAIYLERYDENRRQALIARWRRLEPRNLAPVLHAALPESLRFEQAQTTDVFDSHYDDMLRTLVLRLSRASMPAQSRPFTAQPGIAREEQDMAMAIAFWSAVAQPTFQRMAAPCRAQAMTGLRRAQCRWVAQVLMQRSDILVAESVGAGMAVRLAANPAERAQAEAYRREGEWLIARTSDAYRDDERRFVRRYRQVLFGAPQITERGLMRQLVAEAGYPPTPPPGWDRSHEVRRSGAGH